jgi:hypothetical protein
MKFITQEGMTAIILPPVVANGKAAVALTRKDSATAAAPPKIYRRVGSNNTWLLSPA